MSPSSAPGSSGSATAWFLQERGVAVTVYDSDHAAGGASWGNAGWLTPALAAPLPEPDVLRYGLKSVLTPSSPVYVPPRLDPSLWWFLAGFARHSTLPRWQRGMAAYAPFNRRAIRAFDDLADAGATPRARQAGPFLACYRTSADAGAMLTELRRIKEVGQSAHYDYLTGPQVRRAQPAVSDAVEAAVLIHGQRYIHPPQFVRALAHSVVDRGGKLRESVRISDVETESNAAWLRDSEGARHRHDAVVLATGAALSRLARRFGVKKVVHAGRGYSFTVTGDRVPDSPVYFPDQRVACTPLHEPTAPDHQPGAPADADGPPLLRVAGMMELRRPDEPLDQRRIRAIVEATRELLPGVDFDRRSDEWVGSRPCTADGLPLIGATRSPRVFVAGGHGMWGVVLGPVTGKLLAEQIVTGSSPGVLTPFDPLR
ncbi:NAD(P)/FAD-dependent oxidoreductase [Nocardioides bizhenqiangii]|uniref:FAD-dependent oxidoreductase n=1 Tax=Nocardioides bizhenqiangii TaxID=3095076 RepID=A0ABZ0ZS88_9ACTN|nr:FAD-dependent oxidoreductase [Nocardioides sp. HM61]WQQ27125.1 FAD-dependent oxidoreductase [Nocardioides sp. HM61]